MLNLLKLVFILVVLGGLALIGYAYVGDMEPEARDVTVPVNLNGN